LCFLLIIYTSKIVLIIEISIDNINIIMKTEIFCHIIYGSDKLSIYRVKIIGIKLLKKFS